MTAVPERPGAGMGVPSPLSHAYIITGGSDTSRRTYALTLAQAYVCERPTPPCLTCRHCRKAAQGIHPDIQTVAPPPGKREILAEQARALRADAYIRPNEAGRKVYLIERAESMNPTAQNVLLKVLEEGPPYAAFLLLTAQAGGLLSTIRSRCETLALPPEGPAPAEPQVRESALALLGCLAQGDELSLAQLCVGLEKQEREFLTALLEEFTRLLHQALLLRCGVSPGPAPEAAVRAAAQALTHAQLLSATQAARRLRAACEFNLGPGHLCGWLCCALVRPETV